MQLGRGETIADTARVLSRYVDAIMIRILEPRRPDGDGALRDRAGDQRPHQAVASLPGDGRHPDLRGASRPDPRPQDRLERRLQQRAVVLDRRLGALRLRARHRLPARNCSRRRERHRRARARPAPTSSLGDDPEAAVAGRQRGDLRLLGVDGRRGRRAPPQPARALSGQRRADAAAPRRTRSSCIACPPIAARR